MSFVRFSGTMKSDCNFKSLHMQVYPKHDEDFYGWAMATAALLKKKQYQEVDMNSVIEELESMGASEKRALISRLAQLIFHLLKWQHQPDFREFSKRSWQGSIEEQREQTKIIIEQNPGLKSKVAESITNAYRLSLPMVKKETPLDLKKLPSECPYTFEQLMDDGFFPE